ncbi:bifunctional transaldolase/phosoglucose isomerase [Acaryochloris marina]|uniref:Transaldolase n=1 Tax=Acaryochloris marina (strain MBIC 11017) TaxID=329726 RepID=B0C7G4_ACAM1|nr:bifunctional transaldolase/phosoglucose isomerase [Acaryochloris marina]ABW31248.1 transaldolase [Acaryochloris marina MBIC11017]
MSVAQTLTQPNALQKLKDYHQSVWFDYIRRCSLESGELQELVADAEIQGVTSNPAIFQKAIAGSTDYDAALSALERDHDQDAITLYEQLAIADIQATADILKPLYDRTNRLDGYVSLEVSPYLAEESEQSLQEAKRLWQTVNRPNLMIKVPATPAGIPVIQQLISEGINVNVTLLFSQTAYLAVAEAYISGLEAYTAQGGDPSHIASVASFFISRIDTAIDAQIAERLKAPDIDRQTTVLLQSLQGKVAIANAKRVYQDYLQLCQGSRWQALAQKGAQPQRLLWASTGTKNPQYRDVLYVEELIGAETVNTIPPSTLAAFRDHGQPRASLTEGVKEADLVIASLPEVGINLDAVTDHLLAQGVQLFQQAFDQLLSAVEHKREVQLGDALNRQTYSLPPDLEAKVQATLQDWQTTGKVRRLWAMDASLWTGTDESQWLGWLGTTEDQLAHLTTLESLSRDVQALDINHILLLGMGGSSLCPEVMKLTFGQVDGYPELLVLDSTDPAQVQAMVDQMDLKRTLFIVSSKSGSTLEPNIFQQYFFDLVQQAIGPEVAGSRFIAITDPGSQLQQVAEACHFRHLFFGLPSIGGRYSALSNFGMVPAACMGVDVAQFLDAAEEMVHSCAASVPAIDNPGVVLGIVLGEAAQQGRDKLTLIASPGIADIGAWLEQLLAESTGKDSTGIIPVNQEPLGVNYDCDRIFAYIRLDAAPDPAQDQQVAALKAAGHPVIQICVTDAYQLGQEFFRWEMATAVAGAVLNIHAFNQPDVEASKIATRQLTDAYEQTGLLPTETPIFQEAGLQLFTDPDNVAVLTASLSAEPSLCGFLHAHLSRIHPGDYFALLAYIQMNEVHREQLQIMRKTVCDHKQVATCLGFGPRFLHSTGQAYKGGPNTGVFLQITGQDEVDIPIPGHGYSFGVVKAAQARGDFQVLAERKRRVLRVHLVSDIELGLNTLRVAIQGALP